MYMPCGQVDDVKNAVTTYPAGMGTPWQILRVSEVGLAALRLPGLPTLLLLAPCFVFWANTTATINVAVVTIEKATRKTNARCFIVTTFEDGAGLLRNAL